MEIDISSLPEDVEELKKLVLQSRSVIRELEEEKTFMERETARMADELQLLRYKLFGRRTEKLSDEERLQMYLFDEAEMAVEEEDREEGAERLEVKSYRRRKPKRRPLPASLPREEVVHDISEEEKVCSCGAELVRIGEESSEKLDIVPAQMKVIRHVRPKYACKACEGEEAGEKAVVKIAPPAPQIIPKGIATAGLIAYILVSKFVDALPFYRQEKQFRRLGIEIPRSTMGSWVIEAARRCEPLIELMLEEVLSGPLIQMDETTVQVMKEQGRADGVRSYMWVMRGGNPNHPILLYQYHRSRSGKIPLDYLKDYQGYLQTDGYAGYNESGKLPGIMHVGCWAHARRMFFEAKKASRKAGSAEEALARITKLYAIERDRRELNLPAAEFVKRRKERVEPILKELHSWLQGKSSQAPPSSLLGKAVSYTMGQWEKLIRYLEQDFLTPDTNLVENAIRPFVLGRKNWLFSGSPRGAYASAAIYSLVETAKANNLEPYRYLRHVFERIPLAENRDDYYRLLPKNAKEL